MFDSANWEAALKQVDAGVSRNIDLFRDAQAKADTIKPGRQVIRGYTATLNSVVATDGGHAPIESFPFLALGAIRVVDSSGEELFFDVIGPCDDTDELTQRHLDTGSPLGVLLRELGYELDKSNERKGGHKGPLTLSELSPMIPKPNAGSDLGQRPSSSGWMTVYRDLCEWAAIYDLVCHRDPSEPMSVILRDGLLRSKIFSHNYFTVLGRMIRDHVQDLRKRRRREVFLVGIAKKSEVHARFALAMQLQDVFPEGKPYFAPIPMDLQEDVYQWPEYIRLPDSTGAREAGTLTPKLEDPKYNVGSMHFVRFGKQLDDPVWTVDTLYWQRTQAAKILGCLLKDTDRSYPIPAYPQTLIQADAGAQLGQLDAELLRDAFLKSVGNHVNPAQRTIIDAQVLNVDYASRRYNA